MLAWMAGCGGAPIFLATGRRAGFADGSSHASSRLTRMVNPDDTLPPRPSEPQLPPPPISKDDLADRIVDERTRELDEQCAGWLQRGYVVDDLVGIVCDDFITCGAKVLPRSDVSRRLAGNMAAPTLERAPPRTGRLTVAVCFEGHCVARHIRLPGVAVVPDLRGLLVPLPAERRAILDELLLVSHYGRVIRKEMSFYPFEETIVLWSPAYGLRRVGNRVRVVKPRFPGDSWEKLPTREQVEAARLDVWPGRVLFMIAPHVDLDEVDWSAEWIDPRRLGFDELAVRAIVNRCFEPKGRYQVLA
jgi:hypothetical protein